MQLEKGDSLTKGYTSELWDFTCISVTQNNLQELKEIWAQWDDEVKQLFYCNYGDLPYLLDIKEGQLDRRVTPAPTILAETFRSLSACRRTGEGRFIGCAQLLLAWFHSHFWKVDKVSYRVFSENYSLLEELAATPRRDDITEERWMAILKNLQDEDVEWKAPWMVPDKILYRCGNFDWWHQEIREEKIKADKWERKFQEAQVRNETLEEGLSESQNKKGELKARVAELEISLHHYRNRNSSMELRASLSKIEEMKRRVEELEAALQSCEIRIKLLEASEERQKEQLHFFSEPS
ncbi:hypothetical protein Gotur_027807 [Gossypium turneri]